MNSSKPIELKTVAVYGRSLIPLTLIQKLLKIYSLSHIVIIISVHETPENESFRNTISLSLRLWIPHMANALFSSCNSLSMRSMQYSIPYVICIILSLLCLATTMRPFEDRSNTFHLSLHTRNYKRFSAY